MSITNLRDVREKLLGYRFETVVHRARISRERLVAIEEGAPPTVFEAESLSRLYGIDADLLAEEPIKLAPGDGVATLTLLDEFQDLDDRVRMSIVAAANAARDLRRLQELTSASKPPSLPRLTNPRANLAPHRQGAEHASELRRQLRLKDEPIPSMRDLVLKGFPGIALLYAHLGSDGPAGLSFSDSVRGPAIVLNLDGKNENPLVRRFSLAHELYHLLVDWNRHDPLALISGYLTETGLDRERRANAFAVRLLCPESRLHALRRSISPEEALGRLQSYGLPYPAWRLYLWNEANIDLPRHAPAALVGMGVEPRWALAEEPVGVANFPLHEVPPERRSLVARAAAHLYSTGRIRRGAFVDALGVTPASDVERVLDFFSVDRPDA